MIHLSESCRGFGEKSSVTETGPQTEKLLKRILLLDNWECRRPRGGETSPHTQNFAAKVYLVDFWHRIGRTQEESRRVRPPLIYRNKKYIVLVKRDNSNDGYGKI